MVKKKDFTIDRLIKDYMGYLSTHGMEEENLREHWEWYQQKFPGASCRDYLLYIFNKLLVAIARDSPDLSHFYRYNDELYLQMTYFRRKWEGKKANDLLKLAYENRIEGMKHGFQKKFNIVFHAGKCCGYCDSNHLRELTLEEYEYNPLVGSDLCTSERGCSCVYTFKMLKDEKGDLIPLLPRRVSR